MMPAQRNAAGFGHFTSIAPVGVAAQLAKLHSWHEAHGGPVFTVNHPREFDAFAGSLPPWCVPVPVTFERAFGRDYLPLGAMREGMLRASHPAHERTVFTNSDIQVKSADDIAAMTGTEADLVFASRSDVTVNGTEQGLYTEGFDVFVFTRPALDVLDRDDLRLGMPWWDYMVPTLAILAGHTVRRVDDATFTHVTHQQRWSEVAYQDIGLKCLTEMAPDLMAPATVTREKIVTFARYLNEILNSEALDARPNEASAPFDLKADLRRGIANIFGEADEVAERAEYRPVIELLAPNTRHPSVKLCAKFPATLEADGDVWRLGRNGAPYGGVGQVIVEVERGGRYELEVEVAEVGKRLNIRLVGRTISLDRPDTVRHAFFTPHRSLAINFDPAEDTHGVAAIAAIRLRQLSNI